MGNHVKSHIETHADEPDRDTDQEPGAVLAGESERFRSDLCEPVQHNLLWEAHSERAPQRLGCSG